MKVCNASSSLRQSPRLCWRHFLWQQGSILHTTFDQNYYRSSVHVDLGGWHYDRLTVAWHDLVSNFLDHWRLVDVTMASQNFNKSQSRPSGLDKSEKTWTLSVCWTKLGIEWQTLSWAIITNHPVVRTLSLAFSLFTLLHFQAHRMSTMGTCLGQ